MRDPAPRHRHPNMCHALEGPLCVASPCSTRSKGLKLCTLHTNGGVRDGYACDLLDDMRYSPGAVYRVVEIPHGLCRVLWKAVERFPDNIKASTVEELLSGWVKGLDAVIVVDSRR